MRTVSPHVELNFSIKKFVAGCICHGWHLVSKIVLDVR